MKFTVAIISVIALFLAGCDRDQQDKRVDQQVTCVNNLKQIGLDLMVWAGDHKRQLPFNLSTNAGGTLELCDWDKDGFDRNSFLHFLVVSNELSVPRILICPQDRTKTAIAEWSHLGVSNVTYRLRSGVQGTNAETHVILAVCPVDGNILYWDGSVEEKR